MRALRLLGTAVRALLAQRLRSILAVGSVSVGVAAVVVTHALGVGAERELVGALASMGPNLLVVRPRPVPRTVARRELQGAVTTLTSADQRAMGELPAVELAVPSVSGPVRVKVERASMTATLVGTTPQFLRARSFQVAAGRFVCDEDDRLARRVAVIGARVASELFPSGEAAGATLRVRGVPYEVVGRLAAKGVLADGSDEDGLVVVPLRTAQRRVFNTHWLDGVFVSVAAPGLQPRVERALRALLRERHRLPAGRADDFEVQDKARALAARRDTVAFLALLTTGLAGLALLVGGTGILALMLLSVRERRAEIGLRVAVGATPRDVLLQFLTEALVLALAGWASGLLLGAVSAAALSAATGWSVGASPTTALITLASTVGTGVAFGTLPALRAARVPPILALAGR